MAIRLVVPGLRRKAIFYIFQYIFNYLLIVL
jgi:hypothetical protein